MFTAQLKAEELKYLKTIIDVTTEIISGPRTFTFTQEGVFFESMDQGSVFVCFIIQKAFFSTFNLQNDVLEVRLNIDDLKKILSRIVTADEILTMNFTDSNKFAINFSKANGQGQKRKYELVLHNPEDDDEKRNILQVIKTIPLDSHLKLEPGLLKQLLGDVGIATVKDAKHLQITVDNDLAVFDVLNGSEGMNAHIELPKDNKSIFITSAEKTCSSYDMDYLEKLVKLDTKYKTDQKDVDIELGTDKPLRITFTITEPIEFLFVMAPLVEENEEDIESEDE